MNLYQQNKQQLSELAAAIKATKPAHKQMQRESHYQQNAVLVHLLQIKSQYRHLHIAMSLARGRSYEDIEQPRKGNEPDWDIISRHMQALVAEKELAVAA